MKFYLANLTHNFAALLKICLMTFLFFLANETPAQLEVCQSNYNMCSNQSNIQYICQSKSDEAVGKCIMESGGGSCLAEKITSNNPNWQSCTVTGDQVNWTLANQQDRALQVCLPSRSQLYYSCMQNFYANPLSMPQQNPECFNEMMQCVNNISRPTQVSRP